MKWHCVVTVLANCRWPHCGFDVWMLKCVTWCGSIIVSQYSVSVMSSWCCKHMKGKEMFYLMTHSTHFIYGYMASDIWLWTILIVRKETRCRPIGYSFRLTARVLLYAPSHRQDSTYHGLCYTSRGALAGTRNSSMGSPHEGSIRRPIAPWANTLTTELHLAPASTAAQRHIRGNDILNRALGHICH